MIKKKVYSMVCCILSVIVEIDSFIFIIVILKVNNLK